MQTGDSSTDKCLGILNYREYVNVALSNQSLIMLVDSEKHPHQIFINLFPCDAWHQGNSSLEMVKWLTPKLSGFVLVIRLFWSTKTTADMVRKKRKVILLWGVKLKI